MKRPAFLAAAAAVVLAVLAFFSPFYTVGPTEQVIVLQFGAPLAVETRPGLHFKIPWVQTVAYIDKRLLNVEAPSEEVVSQDKRHLLVDAFARWTIADPVRFNQRLPGKDIAVQRLTTILGSDIRRILGTQTFAAVLSEKRGRLMRDVRDTMNQETNELGIRIVDVQIRRADLPAQDSEAIYKRMEEERKREAVQIRAEGSEIAQRIRARADREATVLLAEATREADILHGEGDAQKTRILGNAYGRDPDFFAFYRSMQAYQDALSSGDTTAVLSPGSDFFRYFMDAAGAARKAARGGR